MMGFVGEVVVQCESQKKNTFDDIEIRSQCLFQYDMSE